MLGWVTAAIDEFACAQAEFGGRMDEMTYPKADAVGSSPCQMLPPPKGTTDASLC